MLLYDVIQTSLARDFSSQVAFRSQKGFVTYSDLQKRVEKAATRLMKVGLKKGERVAFQIEANLCGIEIFLALLLLEASPCLLSPKWPAKKVEQLVKQARASFLGVNPLHLTRLSSYRDNEPKIFLFTSGSTGHPKLVVHNPYSFALSAKRSISLLGITCQSNYLLNLPLFHVSGLGILFRSLLSGASMVTCLETHPVTHLSAVPTQLIRLLREGKGVPSLKSVLLGGACISQSLVNEALSKEFPLQLTYGMTEMASSVTVTKALASDQRIHLGSLIPGKEMQFSVEGEILLRGESLFLGYESEDRGLISPFENGWFATGDLGQLNKLGQLEYVGRKDNMFISGGENIHPETLEKAICGLPDVYEALVIPIEDKEYGFRPIAFVDTKKSFQELQNIPELLKETLPSYYIPDYCFFIPPELKVKEGKLSRLELAHWAKNHLAISR